MSERITVRFAPSPTGPLHIGGVRTALYNFFYAKKNKGKFLLRIEDTDLTRKVEGAEEHIIESLKWVYVEWDEPPIRQSERVHIYQEFAKKLVEAGAAYYAFDTQEELEEMRIKLRSLGIPNPQYDYHTRNAMKNSLTLSPDEVRRKLANNEPYVIRLKVPADSYIEFYDIVRGKISVFSRNVDDKVLIKSDGFPTYHLASVVDDYLMGITHVIRGEEWLPSTPVHVLLYEALGIKDRMPVFAHLPLILKPEGEGKLSKREAMEYGFPIYAVKWQQTNGYREEGFLPEALINYLVLLGWSPPSSKEIVSIDEIVEHFDIKDVKKSGAHFSYEKLLWMNHQYLQKKTPEEIVPLMKKFMPAQLNLSDEELVRLARVMGTRARTLKEFFTASYLFEWNQEQAPELVLTPQMSEILNLLLQKLPDENLLPEQIHEIINEVIKSVNIKKGEGFKLIRMVITGVESGPPLHEIVHFIGVDETKKRISYVLKKHNALQNRTE